MWKEVAGFVNPAAAHINSSECFTWIIVYTEIMLYKLLILFKMVIIIREEINNSISNILNVYSMRTSKIYYNVVSIK